MGRIPDEDLVWAGWRLLLLYFRRGSPVFPVFRFFQSLKTLEMILLHNGHQPAY